MKPWLKRLLITVVVILAVILIAGLLWHFKTVRNYKNLLNDSTQLYQGRITLLNDSVASKDQLVLSLQAAVQLGLISETKLKNEKWKLITDNIKLNEQVSLLSDSIKYKLPPDTIVRIVDNIPTTYIKTPMPFGKVDPFYTIDGRVMWDGIIIDSLRMFSYPEITVGWRRDGFLKKSVPAITYYNKNPNFVLKDAVTIHVDNGIKWYDRKIVWYLLGFGSAYTINAAIK